MKTLLTRLKAVLEADSTLKNYVTRVEYVAPGVIPPLNQNIISYIGLAPIGDPEAWATVSKREVTYTVECYLVLWYTVSQDSIIGVGTQKGIVDFVIDFKIAIRGEVFASGGIDYLSKPTEIVGVDYQTEPFGDGLFVIVSTVTLDCRRLFP